VLYKVCTFEYFDIKYVQAYYKSTLPNILFTLSYFSPMPSSMPLAYTKLCHMSPLSRTSRRLDILDD
jgi:hypothetical protein